MDNAAIAHPDAGRYDHDHGDSHIKDVLPLTKAQQLELLRVSDKLIDDAVTGQNTGLLCKGIDCAVDEFTELLAHEHVPEVSQMTLQEARSRLNDLNAFLEKWYDGMLGVVAVDAEKIVRGAS